MPRRRNQPHPLRFLKGLLWGLPGLIIPVAATFIMRVACTTFKQADCQGLPTLFYVLPLTLFAAGALHSAYRWYRDYPCGELLKDRW